MGSQAPARKPAERTGAGIKAAATRTITKARRLQDNAEGAAGHGVAEHEDPARDARYVGGGAGDRDDRHRVPVLQTACRCVEGEYRGEGGDQKPGAEQ